MKHTGIVINSNVYKDNDLMVELLTENEIISFRSKGVKKVDSKNKSLIFDFAFIEAEFFKKSDKLTLINGKNIINTNKLYSSFEGLVFLSFVKELLHKLIVDEDKHLIYEDLVSALKEIDLSENEDVILRNLIYLMLKIGDVAGFSPLIFYEGSNVYDLIRSFYNKDSSIEQLNKNQLFTIVKRLSFYLEETSDIQINSNLLIVHL